MHDATIFEAMEVDANEDICHDADADEDSNEEFCYHDANEEFSTSVWASIEVDSSVPVSVTICMADLRP